MKILVKNFKYLMYLVVFIIGFFIVLTMLDKSGIGCIYNCNINTKPTYGKVNTYVNGELLQ